MLFDYSQYLRGCLVIPLFVSLFFLHFLLSILGRFLTTFVRGTVNLKEIVSLGIAVLVCAFFLCMNVGRLLHGGVHLFYERVSDAITVQGEISAINDLGRYSFPEMKNEYGYEETNGVQFVIGEVVCTAPTNGVLDVGDYVTVTYLPQSSYILSIFPDEMG